MKLPIIASAALFLGMLSLLWGPYSIDKPAEVNLHSKAKPYIVMPHLTKVAGVEVRCYRKWKWPNYVGWYHWDHRGGVFHNHIKLAPTICDRINYTLKSNTNSSEFQTYQTRSWLEEAWHIYAHEVAHSLGYPESTVDCAAEQIDLDLWTPLLGSYAQALDRVRDWC